jgi:hypothetical protein
VLSHPVPYLSPIKCPHHHMYEDGRRKHTRRSRRREMHGWEDVHVHPGNRQRRTEGEAATGNIYLFVICQTRDNLLFCIPILMMCAFSVLDFIFMMILYMRCLTFFMRYSLHENGRVCSYFISIQQVYTKLEPTSILVDFSLIIYNILVYY